MSARVQGKRLVSAEYLARLESANKRMRAELESLRWEIKIVLQKVAPLRLVEDQWKDDLDRIVRICAKGYSVAPEEIMSRSKFQSTAWARQLAMVIVRKQKLNLGLMEIGAYFGRDHSNVIHATKAVNARRDWPEEAERIERIERECEQIACERAQAIQGSPSRAA
jgi:chromosomal replication initiation ATPase DnaA